MLPTKSDNDEYAGRWNVPGPSVLYYLYFRIRHLDNLYKYIVDCAKRVIMKSCGRKR